MDEIDLKLLRLLQKNSRTPIKTLAGEVRLSSPAVSARIERAGEAGRYPRLYARPRSASARPPHSRLCASGYAAGTESRVLSVYRSDPQCSGMQLRDPATIPCSSRSPSLRRRILTALSGSSSNSARPKRRSCFLRRFRRAPSSSDPLICSRKFLFSPTQGLSRCRDSPFLAFFAKTHGRALLAIFVALGAVWC